MVPLVIWHCGYFEFENTCTGEETSVTTCPRLVELLLAFSARFSGTDLDTNSTSSDVAFMLARMIANPRSRSKVRIMEYLTASEYLSLFQHSEWCRYVLRVQQNTRAQRHWCPHQRVRRHGMPAEGDGGRGEDDSFSRGFSQGGSWRIYIYIYR